MPRNLLFITILAITTLLAHAAEGNASTISEQEAITSDSCFAHIDTSLHKIGETMPRYCEEIYVGQPSPNGYDIKLCYPEFAPLTAKEQRDIKALQKNGLLAPDDQLDKEGEILLPTTTPTAGLHLESYLAVSRKEGYLNVSFCPIVRHDRQWRRILSCQIKIIPTATRNSKNTAPHKLNTDERWAQTSVLAKGKWAKIRVSKEGIYQLTANDIAQMGFANLAKIKIYGYGGQLQNEQLTFPTPDETILQTNTPDDLVEVATHKTSDGRLLFWAEGTTKLVWTTSSANYKHVQNHYSSHSYYFVTESDETGLSVERLPEVSTEEQNKAISLTTVPYATFYDDDHCSWYPGGRMMFDAYNFSVGKTNSYKLSTPGLDNTATGTKSVSISFGAASTISSTSYTINANGTKIGSGTVGVTNASQESARVSYQNINSTAALKANEPNVFQIITANNTDARLNYILVNYPRTLSVSSTPYSFSPEKTGTVTLQISNANTNTRVWRLAQYGSPTMEVPGTNDNGVLNVTTNTPSRRFVAFDVTATYAAPTFVGMVSNQNLHADSAIDYIIIIPTSGKLQQQAERLGKLHADHEGMTYKVVRADQLYNEFSSGTPDANAYRRYLKMLYDRAGNDENALPKYCLFMGKSPWDCRFITDEWKNKSLDDYLLAYEVDDLSTSVGSVNSYVTDDFFALLDDGEGKNINTEKVDLAFGRMVCVSAEEAKRLVDKVETYLSNTYVGSWKNNVVMLADDGERNSHMQDAERVTESIQNYAPNLDIKKVYWDRYKWTSSTTGYTYPQATTRLRQLMTEGAALFNYSGHGSPTILSHYKVLTINDFKQSFSPYMTLWVLASCEIYPFDSDENNLAEASLYLPEGGSIGFMCATRAVYADKNNLMNRAYSQYVLTKDKNGKFISMGEALRLSKVKMINDGLELSKNKLKYVFFGDPALRLAIPTGNVVLDSINGKAVKELTKLETLSAGSHARFSGHICLTDDTESIDEQFDGNVTMTLYDRVETITCKNNQNAADSPMVYDERSKSIFKGSTKAAGGKFTFEVNIPRDISYTNEAGRVSLYAVSNDKQKEYNGHSDTFCLNGTYENAEPDNTPPTLIAYINSIDNPDYTITDENPVLIVDISDDYGINYAGNSLGHDIELVLDGNTADYINLNSYFNYDFGSYQKGQIIYPIKGMAQGTHTASIKVWDVNNNVATTDVHFIVRGANAVAGANGYITASKNPATTATNFITYFPANSDVEGLVTYEVYDTRGKIVYKQPVAVTPGSSSACYEWNLCGNDHQALPSGIYFYRAVVATSNGTIATDAQKLIITRQ